MHSDWFSGVGEPQARVPESLGAGGLGLGEVFVAAGEATGGAGVVTAGLGCGAGTASRTGTESRAGATAVAAGGVVSCSAALGSRYAPIESTRSVSRFARARSAASAESAANSSAVRDGVPESQANASIAIAIIAAPPKCLQIIIAPR